MELVVTLEETLPKLLWTMFKQISVIKFVSDMRQVGGFLRVLWFPPPINWPPQYNWNIVESGIKHHKTKPLFFTICYFRVIECSDLPVTNGGCNPYAMVTLTYSKSRNKVDIKKTTVKKKTICPQYNECFHFVVNISFIYCSHMAEWLISGFGKLFI